MNAWSRIIPWIIILIPFLVLAYSYDSLQDPVLISRSFFGDAVTVAPKSLFTVFRVPLIEVVCGGVIEVMRRKARGATSKNETDYYLFWTILLYTVGAKSILQTAETVSAPTASNLIYYLTFGTVICGVFVAVILSRKMFSNLKDLPFKLQPIDLALLVALFFAYIGLALVPFYSFT